MEFKHWLKRAPGLKIFLAVWLLVLIIPLWRLRAVRQAQNTQIDIPNLGLTNQEAVEAGRRFLNEEAAQLVAMSVPNLGLAYPFSFPKSPTQNELNAYSNRLAASSEDYFKRFAILSRRYPKSLLIRSQWLRSATQGQLNIEPPDLMATYQLTQYPGKTVVAKTWLSVAQLEAAIRCAQEGAALEPDNAYWPWMEAILQFSLRRDNQGITCLEKAGRCSRFDDGTTEVARTRIACMHRLRTADFDDDLAEAWNFPFPHLAKMRAVARATMWQANLALKRGDKAQALHIAQTLQDAGWPVANTRGYYIPRLVGQAMCYIAWRQLWFYAGVKAEDYGGKDNRGELMRAETIAKFTAFARQNGRPDLARRAATINADIDRMRQRPPAPQSLAQLVIPLMTLHWLSSWCLRLALASALVWLLMWTISRHDSPSPSLRRSMALWAAFCLGVTGVLGYVALQAGAIDRNYVTFDDGFTAPNKAIDASLPYYAALIWLVPIALTSFLSLVQRPQFQLKERPFQWSTVALWLLYGGLFTNFFLVVEAISAPIQNTVAGQLWPAPLLLFGAFLLGTSAFHIWRSRPAMKISGILISSGFALLASACFLYTGRDTPESSGDIGPAIGGAVLFFLAGIAVWFRAGGTHPLSEKQFLTSLIYRTRLMAATLAVATSVIYFALILVAMPVRHNAQQMLNGQLEKGEIAMAESL